MENNKVSNDNYKTHKKPKLYTPSNVMNYCSKTIDWYKNRLKIGNLVEGEIMFSLNQIAQHEDVKADMFKLLEKYGQHGVFGKNKDYILTKDDN